MKSPWKFLSELTSGRRTQAKPGASVTTDSQPGATGKETLRVQLVIGHSQAYEADEEPSRLELGASTAVPIRGTDEIPVVLPDAVSESQADVKAELRTLLAEPHVLVDDVEGLPSEPKKTKLKPKSAAVKRGTASTSPLEVVAENTGRNPNPTPASRALELDDEIMQLRRQLAAKLDIQNAQLKRMLERFDS